MATSPTFEELLPHDAAQPATFDDLLASKLRALQSERAAIEEQQLSLAGMLTTAASSHAMARAEASHCKLQAHSAALARAQFSDTETENYLLRAAAADDNERLEEILMELRSVREEAARHRDRVVVMELDARLLRQQRAEAEQRATKHARRLSRQLAYARWRQLGAARALQVSRRTVLEDAVHSALHRATSCASLALSTASADGDDDTDGGHGATDVAEAANAPGFATANGLWSLDAWLGNLPLASMVARALRARLVRADAPDAPGAERTMLAALSDAADSADEHGAVFTALLTEASLVDRVSEAIADEVDRLASALRRADEGRHIRTRRIRAHQQQSAADTSDSGTDLLMPQLADMLSVNPAFGRMISEDETLCAPAAAMGTGGGGGAVRRPPGARDAMVAMRVEHCASGDSHRMVTLGAYAITTSSEIEFTFVVDPTPVGLASVGLESWPVETRLASELSDAAVGGGMNAPTDAERRRQPTPLGTFDRQRKEISERLARVGAQMGLEALVACRLYCGPLAAKYNAALHFQAAQPTPSAAITHRFEALTARTPYTSTIATIDSAVHLLSKLTVCCPLYRGLASGALPAPLSVADEMGCRVVCDPGFLSTTPSARRAFEYAEASDALVLEVSQGLSGRAADMGWLSQYPHEEEYVLPPGTCLEMHKVRVDGSVALCEVRAVVQTSEAVVGPATSHSPDAIAGVTAAAAEVRAGAGRDDEQKARASWPRATTVRSEQRSASTSLVDIVAAISQVDEASSELQAIERRAVALRAATAARTGANKTVAKSESWP